MTNPAQLNNLQGAPLVPFKQLSYLETIVDKKVNNVALSCFETIIHWFLTTFSCFYSAYDRLYQEQLSRIKLFSDGTIIKDLTAGKIVSIIREPLRTNYPQTQFFRKPHPVLNHIALNGHKVLFSADENPRILFGKKFNTDHMVIKDSKSRPKQIIIKEYETTGIVRKGVVDTNQIYNREGTGRVYLTEEAREACIQSGNWQNLQRSID